MGTRPTSANLTEIAVPISHETSLGSTCEPEGTECRAGSDEYGCSEADSSHCYTDSCELYPDGVYTCLPVCSASSDWLYYCVPGGLCQLCEGEWRGTLILCSDGLWKTHPR